MRKRPNYTITVTAGPMYHNGEGYVCKWSARLTCADGTVFIGTGNAFTSKADAIAQARAAGYR